MNRTACSVITGTGSFIPEKVMKNESFSSHTFFEANETPINKSNSEIIAKFAEITTIEERRYALENVQTSDIAYLAAKEAIQSSGINQEELDYIIVAHNFGDIKHGTTNIDIVPCIAARVKFLLGIKNPKTIAYDTIFGCPGWVQATIQADYYLRSGDAQKILVIGADILSRIADPHDRDSMIYADGAGAVVLERKELEEKQGIIKHKTRSDTFLYSKMLTMGPSYDPAEKHNGQLYIKMNGRRLYQYALENVPTAIKECIDDAGYHISDIKKILIHQANGKMDDAILKRLFELYSIETYDETIMPMTISTLGNSSVATVPTLLDLIGKGMLKGHTVSKGDLIVFASVGAGMNINAILYKY